MLPISQICRTLCDDYLQAQILKHHFSSLFSLNQMINCHLGKRNVSKSIVCRFLVIKLTRPGFTKWCSGAIGRTVLARVGTTKSPDPPRNRSNRETAGGFPVFSLNLTNPTSIWFSDVLTLRKPLGFQSQNRLSDEHCTLCGGKTVLLFFGY